MRVYSVLGLVVLLTACASQQRTETDELQASTAQPAAAAPVETPATPAVATNTAASPEDATDREFRRAVAKHRMVYRDGKTMYCRKEKPLGSRLPQDLCFTEEQLRESLATAEDARDKLRQTGGAPCGSSNLTC